MAKAHVIYVTKDGKSKQHIAFYDKESARTFARTLSEPVINEMYTRNIHCFILPDIRSPHLKDAAFMKKLNDG